MMNFLFFYFYCMSVEPHDLDLATKVFFIYFTFISSEAVLLKYYTFLKRIKIKDYAKPLNKIFFSRTSLY